MPTEPPVTRRFLFAVNVKKLVSKLVRKRVDTRCIICYNVNTKATQGCRHTNGETKMERYRVEANSEEIAVRPMNQDGFMDGSILRRLMSRHGVELFSNAEGYTHDSDGNLLKGRKYAIFSKSRLNQDEIEELMLLNFVNAQNGEGGFADRKAAEANRTFGV